MTDIYVTIFADVVSLFFLNYLYYNRNLSEMEKKVQAPHCSIMYAYCCMWNTSNMLQKKSFQNWV